MNQAMSDCVTQRYLQGRCLPSDGNFKSSPVLLCIQEPGYEGPCLIAVTISDMVCHVLLWLQTVQFLKTFPC
jgi:hypothetical protein